MAALEQLAALHRENSQSAGLIRFQRSAVPAAAGLMVMGVGHLALGGGPSMAGDFFWALAVFVAVAALLVAHIRSNAAAFGRAPLTRAATSLRLIYVLAGAAWGSGGLLALLPDAPTLALLAFGGVPSLFIALLLNDTRAALGFLMPVMGLCLFSALNRPPLASTAMLVMALILAAFILLRRRHRSGLQLALP